MSWTWLVVLLCQDLSIAGVTISMRFGRGWRRRDGEIITALALDPDIRCMALV